MLVNFYYFIYHIQGNFFIPEQVPFTALSCFLCNLREEENAISFLCMFYTGWHKDKIFPGKEDVKKARHMSMGRIGIVCMSMSGRLMYLISMDEIKIEPRNWAKIATLKFYSHKATQEIIQPFWQEKQGKKWRPLIFSFIFILHVFLMAAKIRS